MAKNCGKHYKCVDQNNFQHLQADTLGILAGVITLAGIFIPTWAIAGGVLLVMAIWDLCRFLEGGKLVCLEENVCVIGKVMELIPVGEDKSGFDKMDDDFTFNILVSPHAENESYNEIVADTVQGKYVTIQQPTIDLGLNFDQEKRFENLFHCEIKGCRVHDVCIALKIMGVVGAGVTAFCAVTAAAGPLGWLACAIALVIWAIVTAIVVGITWAATHNGALEDVVDPASGQINVGDLILIKGDFVHDAGHDHEGGGWNEIQPVRSMQKLTAEVDERFHGTQVDGDGKLQKASEELIKEFKAEVLDIWCTMSKEVDTETVRKALEKPENTWGIHPLIDGCRAVPIIT